MILLRRQQSVETEVKQSADFKLKNDKYEDTLNVVMNSYISFVHVLA